MELGMRLVVPQCRRLASVGLADEIADASCQVQAVEIDTKPSSETLPVALFMQNVRSLRQVRTVAMALGLTLIRPLIAISSCLWLQGKLLHTARSSTKAETEAQHLYIQKRVVHKFRTTQCANCTVAHRGGSSDPGRSDAFGDSKPAGESRLVARKGGGGVGLDGAVVGLSMNKGDTLLARCPCRRQVAYFTPPNSMRTERFALFGESGLPLEQVKEVGMP